MMAEGWLVRPPLQCGLVGVLLVALFLGLGILGCSGNKGSTRSPTEPSPSLTPTPSTACRNYASSVTATATSTVTPGGSGPVSQPFSFTGSYNGTTNQALVSGTFATADASCLYKLNGSTTYSSVADFVDEVSVIPPRSRSTGSTGTLSYVGSRCPAGTVSLNASKNSGGACQPFLDALEAQACRRVIRESQLGDTIGPQEHRGAVEDFKA